MTTLLAHSPRGNTPAQTYRAHVEGVTTRSVENAHAAAGYYVGDRTEFVGIVENAGIYHDLGKLDTANQSVLRVVSRAPLPIRHEDAGIAALLRQGHLEAAVLVAAHHAGLFCRAAEVAKSKRAFRLLEVADHVDEHLAQYIDEHERVLGRTLSGAQTTQLHANGLKRRLALSCLVDGDHGDTAANYGKEVPLPKVDGRWAERLEALERHVATLGGKHPVRDRLRQRVFDECRNAQVAPSIRACDAPVGSGKTTAVMAHLLNVAAQKQLRHIFVVLPYVSIIRQSVEVYRRALVLPGENPEDVVAEHHHQADFEQVDGRQLATLWKAPIIVTTAVQFFETLGSHRPARLRKLHELPGSAVFVDETHAAIPARLWRQVWLWLESWCQEWSGHIVFGSGSLARFWELGEFVNPPKASVEVPDLVPTELRQELVAAEERRISPRSRDDAVDCAELIRWVASEPGPRLVIVNTVQSAAVLARRMREEHHRVLHLSTALAPAHRARIVERVKDWLDPGNRVGPDWTLVATSLVEAGMDFSFCRGFRERASASSLIQVGGRVSRGGEHEGATVWDFRMMDEMISNNPGLRVPQQVLGELFRSGQVDRLAPSELAKVAMRAEVTSGDDRRADELIDAERRMDYPRVSELCQVIDGDTVLAVVDAELAARLRSGERVDRRQVLRYSIRIQTWKVEKQRLPLSIISGEPGEPDALYQWTGVYDEEFLGYMAGILPILEGIRDGIFLA